MGFLSDLRFNLPFVANERGRVNARVDLYNEQKAQYMPMLSHYPIVRLLKLGITGADIDEARYQLTYKIALRTARWDSA